ncbi:hypothetical protein LCGC14_0923040 [marine sediment metagenome]|uniref:Uncharacterized protein n=1 Tax=marine sediment metagenome TaxID=412755 RepID=A0A0F9R8X8_9ZZZZ
MFDAKEYHRKYQQTHRAEHNAANKKYRQTIRGWLCGCFHHIKERCVNSRHPRYRDYGGRGIKCLFKSSQEFADYVVNELQIDPRNLEVDRIDNNGHYEPGNIRFVTSKENCNNRRTPHGWMARQGKWFI